MKPTELMIGDWIMTPSGYRQVEQNFAGDGIGVFTRLVPDYEYPEGWDEDEISPIPLTPEILAKNGFKVMHGFGYCEKYPTYGWGYHKEVRDYASVDVTFYNEPIAGVSTLVRMETNSSKGDGVNKFHSCDCDYVHQLQHALRLAGIKKEITL